MWGVKDGKQVRRMETKADVLSLAASKDGKWIAAGTSSGMFVWDAETYEGVIKRGEGNYVLGVDFSPDSTRLVAATSNGTAIVWDLASGKQVQTLPHSDEGWVRAAKYSPRGDRIATSTCGGPVRVWDSNDGRWIVDIKVPVTLYFNTGLLWSNDHLFVVSDEKIKELDASTGLELSEWPVPDTNDLSSIALPNHEGFIASSAIRTITYWDTSTHDQLPVTLQYPEDIHSIAFSPDDRILAIGGGEGKITLSPVSTVSCWVISSLNSFLAPAFSPSVSPTSYSPRTRHSNRRHCIRLVEARSARKRRSVIDCVDQPVAESEPLCTRQSSSRSHSFA